MSKGYIDVRGLPLADFSCAVMSLRREAAERREGRGEYACTVDSVRSHDIRWAASLDFVADRMCDGYESEYGVRSPLLERSAGGPNVEG